MFKRDLYFSCPLMNAAGTLGFAPDPRLPLDWAQFGAFVTNPLSWMPRQPAANPAVVEFAGGFLLHSGLPNPGLPTALKRYARAWKRSALPIVIHLMADRPEETLRMVRLLEGVDNVMAVEFGFAPQLAGDIIVLAVEMCQGELPIIVCLPPEQVLALGPQVMDAGAAAVSLGAPRGMLGDVTGRLYGPGLLAQSLLVARDAARLGLPVISAGGVYARQDVDAMLAAGALAVQVDAALWRGAFSLAA
ncbi:MAG: hypothetical protein WHV44_08510 [Anaerolineales bacterium]